MYNIFIYSITSLLNTILPVE